MRFSKKTFLIIVLFFLFVFFQTNNSLSQDSDPFQEISSTDNDSELTYLPPEEVETEEAATDTNNKDEKQKDESPEITTPESTTMSMSSGEVSELAAGGVYSNPEAVTVSQVGAATLSYPISVPPGRNGLQPRVSLQYSSYNGNGWVGVGWDLDLGSIKRSTRNGLDYNADDYVVNGSDLVHNNTWGTDYYCEKIEGAFTKYYYNSASNYWIATAKDGTTYRYGYTTASRMASGSATYSWQLDRIEDTNGNYMTVSYTTDSGQIYPYQISYTGSTHSLSPNKTVEFELEDRDDDPQSYKTKALITTSKRLKTITVKVGTTTVYKYSLAYEYSPGNGRSRLVDITRVDPDDPDNTLPPTDFTWIDGGDGTFGTADSTSLNGSSGGTVVFGDINGDGRTDFIKAYSSGTNPYVYIYPYLANNTEGFTAQTVKTLAQCPTNAMSISLGDVNGDGKADILSNGLNGQVHVYLSDGNGSFSSKYTNTGASSITSVFLAELNGDGMADLVKFNRSTGYVYTALSDGNGYFGTQNTFNTSLSDIQNIKIKLAEVNGDGKADLYVYNYFAIPPYVVATAMRIFPGNGDGTFSSSPFFTCGGRYVYSDSIADINGDGLSDLAYLDENRNVYVYLSTGIDMTQASPNITGYTTNSSFGKRKSNPSFQRQADMVTFPL